MKHTVQHVRTTDPGVRFGSKKMLTGDDVRRYQKKQAALPKTKEVLHELRHLVQYSEDGKKYRIRATSKRDRAKWREMQRPYIEHMKEDGQRANAQEKKRMFVNPVTGKKSYVFESMVEGIERKTKMRAKRSSNSFTERTVYKHEAPGLHEYVYRNVPKKGIVLVRHDVYEKDAKSNTLKLVRSWKKRGVK